MLSIVLNFNDNSDPKIHKKVSALCADTFLRNDINKGAIAA